MGKIVVSENVSLDGVVQDPAGDEGFSRGGWVGLIAAREDVAKIALDEAVGPEAFLLGRRSYEWLAARWRSRNGELADRPNSIANVSTSFPRPSKIPTGTTRPF
jgi:dihydrofolate reductase